jgi:zinc protease
VTDDEVKALADETYGKIPSNREVTWLPRRQEPPHRAPFRVDLKDARAGKASVQRYYVAPSYRSAQPGDAEALDLLLKITAGGTTSRLYKKLVMDSKVASSASGWYSGAARDSGKIALQAVAADGVDLATVEAAIDAVLNEVKSDGVTEAEVERAKKAMLAEYVYASDNQMSLARRYGWSLTVGRSLKDVEEWPNRISKVTAEDVKRVAAQFLDIRNSVTGTLVPIAPDATSKVEGKRKGASSKT